MKKVIIFVFVILIENCYSQNIMTVGEVFNFDIDDVFQYKSELTAQPPNAHTRRIIHKYYSAGNDTVFYKIARNYYNSSPVMNPQPHLEYTFYADTIEEFYTDLNSSIFDYNPYLRYDSLVAHYDTAFSYDSLLYYSAELCNYWINGFSCNLRIYDVESDSYNYLFGEGLGIVTATIVNGDPYGNPSVNNKLTYFEKGSNTCGVYDALTSIIKNELLNGLSLFPNPVKECLHVGFTNNVNEKIFIEVYDIQNKLLNRSLVEKGIALIDFRMFSSGIYLLKIVSNSGVVVKKVMKD